MIRELTVNHHEHISDLPYDDVVALFMEVTGSVEEGYDSVASSAQTKEDFELIFKRREGSSGFMRFLRSRRMAQHSTLVTEYPALRRATSTALAR